MSNFPTKEQLRNAANSRFATKTFDAEKQISEEDWKFLMELAHLTPSSIGLEPWKVLDIQNPELRKKLFPISWGAQRGQLDASHYIVILSAKQQMFSEEEGYVKKMMSEIHHFPAELVAPYSNKVAHMFDGRVEEARELAYFDYSVHQAHLMAMNICNNAALMGIDTCMIGGVDADAYDKLLGEEMGLYDTKKWSVGLCVAIGYHLADAGHGKTRKPFEEFYQVVE